MEGIGSSSVGSLNDTVSLGVPPVRAVQPAPLARPCPRPHDPTLWRRFAVTGTADGPPTAGWPLITADPRSTSAHRTRAPNVSRRVPPAALFCAARAEHDYSGTGNLCPDV